ncbi:PH domain-containing protein [Streptomyces palmae]|uniref:PH domain-containing protein n=1 Tax=Streptomyces palmae TaxID=1701085 RepID=A0A4Z0H6L0_9ACTN|nr:PH domain-containing protein [Streptomyces palmae]TGB08661.1 PH domain-containing protein [Streptomyces palmae]
MTSPDDDASDEKRETHDAHQPAAPTGTAGEPAYPDRVFRSPSGIAGGVLLLVLAAWLGVDAMVNGEDQTPWLALAGLVLVVPLVVAFTIRPAVFAGADRLKVRNPFRTVTLPWASVEGVRAGYSSEVLAGGSKYQMWAVPVSLRQRKRATRRQAQAAAGDLSGQTKAHSGVDIDQAVRAAADRTVMDLRELAERNADRPGAKGEPEVRWAIEVLAPALAGAVLLLVLLAIG